MALPLGKLTFIVGVGLVGSVLAKEGRISNVSDFFSGALKIVYKQLKHDDSTASRPKPINDSLMQQVNSLREELQLLASNRSVTIVTGNRSASGKYGVVVIVVAVGYGYIWWKGWELSDMMFATRRGLNDACSSVAKQLETVYSSISVTKRHLSSRIDRVDCKLDECADNTVATRVEVSELLGDVKEIGSDVQSVHHVVRSLETKISRIEVRQNQLNCGVGSLVGFVQNLQSSIRSMDQIEGAASSSSRLAIEPPKGSPSRALSLPIKALGEPPPPSSSDGSPKKQTISSPIKASAETRTPSTSNGSPKKPAVFLPSTSTSGLKELYGLSDGVGVPVWSSPIVLNGKRASEETNIDRSTGGLIGRFSGFLSRSRSALPSAK